MGELSEMAERIKGFESKTKEQTKLGYARQDAAQDRHKSIPNKRMHPPAKKRQRNTLRAPASQQNIILRGKAKDDYLSNFRYCIKCLEQDSKFQDSKFFLLSRSYPYSSYPYSKPRLNILKNFNGLACIMEKKPSLEISPTTGMPSAPTMLAIDYASKNKDKELKELASKISSGFSDDDKEKMSLEDMLAARIKSKIYSFDTAATEVIHAEGKPLQEIFAPEFALRDRKYLLDAIQNNDFTIDHDILTSAALSSNKSVIGGEPRAKAYLIGNLSFSGYDFAQGNFSKSIMAFFVNGIYHNRIFSALDDADSKMDATAADIAPPIMKIIYFTDNDVAVERLLRPKYQKSLGEAFEKGNIDRLYQEASEIRYFYPCDIMKLTLKRFYNAHTDNSNLGLPKEFFNKNPAACVMDIASERITALYDLGQYLRDKKYRPETKKETTTFRLYSHSELGELLSKGSQEENIRQIPIKLQLGWK